MHEPQKLVWMSVKTNPSTQRILRTNAKVNCVSPEELYKQSCRVFSSYRDFKRSENFGCRQGHIQDFVVTFIQEFKLLNIENGVNVLLRWRIRMLLSALWNMKYVFFKEKHVSVFYKNSYVKYWSQMSWTYGACIMFFMRNDQKRNVLFFHYIAHFFPLLQCGPKGAQIQCKNFISNIFYSSFAIEFTLQQSLKRS